MKHRINIVMRLLLFQLRVIELSQLSQIVPFDRASKRSLSRWIKRMEQKGLLQTTRTVSVVPKVYSPLIDWSVGAETPAMKVVRNRLRQRWKQWIPRRCNVIWASSHAVQLFGGAAGGRRQPLQLAHDLGTSAVYVQLTQKNPVLQQQWYGEDYLRLNSIPIPMMPDAALLNESHQPTKLIEFGGQYSLQKLNRWHQNCASSQLSYELW